MERSRSVQIAHLLAARQQSAARGDLGLVAEISLALARLGYDEVETTVARGVDEAAVPSRPRRGGPRSGGVAPGVA